MSDQRERSGDFSHDPALDPEQLFRVFGTEENEQRISEAMRAFVARGDDTAVAEAIAVFVRSARARGDPIERVLAVLIELASEREGAAYPHDWEPTALRSLVLRGVLLAFYGDAAGRERAPDVERRRGSERRRPDPDRGSEHRRAP